MPALSLANHKSMALVTVDFKTTFRFETGPPKTFLFEDTTDYAGQGVALADVTGVLKIIAPDNTTIYNNINHAVPDIDPDVSLLSVIPIDLPLLGGGGVQQGDYIITYTVEDTSGTPFTVDQEKTLDLDYVSPVVDLDMVVNCTTPLLTSTDNTPYTVGGITPDITRDHQILYPATTGQAPVLGTSQVLQTGIFFTLSDQALQHSSLLISDLTYTFASDFIVTDQINGNGFIDITCAAQLCDLYCCIRAQWLRYLDQLGRNRDKAAAEFAIWQEMIGISEQIRIAQDCGKGDDISDLVGRILQLGGCEAGCGCDDGEPQQVIGLGGGTGIVVVDSGGTPVIVTAVINGNTTTYTVSLVPSFVSKVNDSYNASVSAGTNVTVTPTVDVNGNIDYKVDFTSNITQVEILSFLVEIDLGAGTLPTITVSDISRQGTAFSLTPVVQNENFFSVNIFEGKNTHFKLVDMWDAQGALEFKPDIHIIDKITGLDVPPQNVFLEMFGSNTDFISFRFLRANGSEVTGSLLNGYDKIKLQITLTA